MVKSVFRLVLVGLLLALSTNLSAQRETFKMRHNLGYRGSAVASEFGFVPAVTQSLHIGWGAGMYYRLDVEKYASLILEANYRMTGWKERYDLANHKYSRDLHSINLPILTHLHYDFSFVRIFLNLGPIMGYTFMERWSSEGDKFSEWAKQRHQKKIENRMFWGLGGGPGLSFRLAKGQYLEVEGRYVASLGNIWGNRRQDPYGLSAERQYEVSINYIFEI